MTKQPKAPDDEPRMSERDFDEAMRHALQVPPIDEKKPKSTRKSKKVKR